MEAVLDTVSTLERARQLGDYFRARIDGVEAVPYPSWPQDELARLVLGRVEGSFDPYTDVAYGMSSRYPGEVVMINLRTANGSAEMLLDNGNFQLA